MKLLPLLLLFLFSSTSYASPTVWVDQGDAVAARSFPISNSADRIFNADLLTLQLLLDQAPHEDTGDRSHIITLPMPDGSTSRYRVVESPIIQTNPSSPPPRVKTYRVFGVDDPGASGRIDIGPSGFHGMVFTSQGRIFIDPASDMPLTTSYASGYASKMTGSQFSCGVDHMMDRSPVAEFVELRARGALARVSGQLLTYRLAVSATREFADRITDSAGDADVNDVITTAINRVNEIYERDLGIRLLLVGNGDTGLIEQSGDDQFTDSNGFALLSQNTNWLNGKLTSGGYDVGHVFASAGGGLARIGSVCQSTKAEGFSGRGSFPLTPPINADRFFIDYVAHELGHQFGADHSFNGTTLNCVSPNRVSGSAFEPGSGSTIMAYADICGAEDLQSSTDATFHAASIAQINNFVNGPGNACDALIDTDPVGNSDPVVSVVTNKTVPKGTAFFLDAVATDGDGDTLSYQWDQMDSGTATDANSFGTDLGDNALFRSYLPRLDVSRRDFPSLDTQIQGWYDDAEVLPCRSREMNFRLTVRDNESGQGTRDVKLSVDGNSGPFTITNFNTPGTINPAVDTVSLTWDVANTFRAPVACGAVKIDLLASADPDYSDYSVFPLVASTLNDGSAIFSILPADLNAPYARFRVTCSDNYFYDISDARLQINGGGSYTLDDFTTFPNEKGETLPAAAPECPVLGTSSGRSSRSGGGSVSWLIPLFGIVGLLRRQFRAGNAF